MAEQHEHDDTQFTQEFWDDRYESAGRLWSGQPNVQLVAQASDLPPGDALEVGSGEGADAIWLAERGWQVTAVDVSQVALDRAARQAAAAGAVVAARITWQQRDMLSWEPGPDRYDLVSAQFMHLPGDAQQAMHRRLAAAVRPGGTLLIVGHVHEGMHASRPAARFRSAQEIAGSLDPASWQVLVAGPAERSAIGPDGEPVMLRDSVLRAVRQPATG